MRRDDVAKAARKITAQHAVMVSERIPAACTGRRGKGAKYSPKICYPNKWSAELAGRKMVGLGYSPTRAYKCETVEPIGVHWHLTTQMEKPHNGNP